MIEVRSLSKIYKDQSGVKDQEDGRKRAVNEIDFSCEPGRVFSLIGPNGAGKTTTLRMISTILKPTSGSITVNGFDVVNEPREVRQNLGFLTGTTGLYERLTPEELVRYFADLNGVEKSVFRQRKEELFDILDIHPFAKKRIGKLSTGMRQRVSIARTMIHDPQVMVFDEPTAGLDVISAHAIIELIRSSKKAGKTVIFSTHIMGEVSLLSDDLAIIHNGKICYLGTYADFEENLREKTVVEEFIRIVKEN